MSASAYEPLRNRPQRSHRHRHCEHGQGPTQNHLTRCACTGVPMLSGGWLRTQGMPPAER
jgi:hypothetical protein